MSSQKKDFFGKEVADAIKEACTTFNAPQEKLDIEVVETGSSGIFGLIRKKAHIKVALKENKKQPAPTPTPTPVPVPTHSEASEKTVPVAEKEIVKTGESTRVAATSSKKVENKVSADKQDEGKAKEPKDDAVSQEDVDIVHAELEKLLTCMGYPSSLSLTVSGRSVKCQVGNEYEEQLTGAEGKVLDSLQYLLRKMITRKCERVKISIDVGEYRQKRREELKVRALELAEKVKEDGKTQIITALNPSERRVVHMILQEDKAIRSRSVGEGLFKKILIYKPGKGKKGGGGQRRSGSRGRKPRGGNKKPVAKE